MSNVARLSSKTKQNKTKQKRRKNNNKKKDKMGCTSSSAANPSEKVLAAESEGGKRGSIRAIARGSVQELQIHTNVVVVVVFFFPSFST